MKRFLVGVGLVMWLAMSPMRAEAAVTDWPVIGQVAQVGICLISDAGHLGGSLLGHLGAWGAELLKSVSHCAQLVVGTVTDTAVDVVSLRVPTPEPATTTETP